MKRQFILLSLLAMATFCQFPTPSVSDGLQYNFRRHPWRRKCQRRPMLNMGNMDSSSIPFKISAIGFQYNSGALWAAICKDTPHGDIPCKVHSSNGSHYSWGGQEYRWNNSYQIVYGELVSNKAKRPCKCKPKGYQFDDEKRYFNAVIPSKHGLVPGKANLKRTMAWYPWGQKEYFVQDHFYIIC